MTGPACQPGGTDIPFQRRTAQDADRAGTARTLVQALVHRGSALLLVDRHCDGAWSVPVAWVHPTETIPSALDRLCGHQLGLTNWDADFAATTVCRLPDSTEVLQLAFDITLHSAANASSSCGTLWWNTRTEPPKLHRPSRPVLELLFDVPPR